MQIKILKTQKDILMNDHHVQGSRDKKKILKKLV